MSHFASQVPITAGSLAPASYDLSQDGAINTINKNLFVMVSASIDFNTTTASPQLLFTTASDRGRFFPTKVILIPDEIVGSAGSGGPLLKIGQTSPDYQDWMNDTLTTAQYDQYRAGQYEFGTLANVFANTYSAAPNTPIYWRVTFASNNTTDIRTLMLMGYYTNQDT